MRGKRGKQGSKGGSGQPFKKVKRSKGYWQQRKTQTIAAVPQDSDQDSESDHDDGMQQPMDQYHHLLNAFSQPNNQVDEDEKEDVIDDSDDLEDEDESGDEEIVTGVSESDDEASKSDLNEEASGSDSNDEADDSAEEMIGGQEEDDSKEQGQVGSSSDPFVAKYTTEIPSSYKSAVDQRQFTVDTRTWPSLGHFQIQTLSVTAPKAVKKTKKNLLTLENVEEEEEETDQALVQEQQALASKKLAGYESFLKIQLRSNLEKANHDLGLGSELTGLQSELLTIFSSYKDFISTQRTLENGEEYRLVYALHALNHVLKTRTKILHNNEKMAKVKSTKKRLNMEARDQGLCRPKVLIVVPFREAARRVVAAMELLLFGAKGTGGVANRKRFEEDYGKPQPVGQGSKPDDHYEMFNGNTDDGFKIGISVARKSLKLYSEFYSSDVIIASPLGLRMVIGDEEEDGDHDFLASIEVLILDQVDVYAMQNWDHVTHLVSHVNLQPVKPRGGIDYSRVRMWSLNQLSKYYRQTLMFGAVAMPEMNAIFNKNCHNFCGKVKLANPQLSGSICQVVNSNVPIIFRKFDTDSVTQSAQDRLQFFVKKIMPDFKQDTMYHTLVVVPSYFDFVQVRNWFDKESDLDFAEICEYTKYNKMAASRDRFFHGEHHFLVYTERAHFFKRFTIKGVRHLIFYQLPQYPHFFSEICNAMQPAYQNRKGGSDSNMSCTVIYSKYDVHRLASVVGTERTQIMLKSEKSVHMFDTGK